MGALRDLAVHILLQTLRLLLFAVFLGTILLLLGILTGTGLLLVKAWNRIRGPVAVNAPIAAPDAPPCLDTDGGEAYEMT